MSSDIVTRWSDSTPRQPVATVVLCLLCLLSLVLYSTLGPMEQQAVIDIGGMRPSDIAALLSRPAAEWWNVTAVSLVSSLFIHASWLHLAGNLAYLWVFGMPVEQRVGSLSMLAIFISGGALANVIVALRVPGAETPIIGASAAISAVVGAYLGLFPSRRIGLFIPLGLYLQFARLPALVVIGSWFTLQLLYSVVGPINGTVAWWTHLAGFALGLSLVLLGKAMALTR